MSCIDNYVDWWGRELRVAFTYEDRELPRVDVSRYLRGLIINRNQIPAPQCQVMIRHITEDVKWHYIGHGLLVAAGMVASICVLVAGAIAAYVAIQLTAVFFTGLSIFLDMLIGEYLVTYIVLGTGFVSSALVEVVHVAAGTALTMGFLWTRGIMPFLHESARAIWDMNHEIRRLELLAALPVR